MTFWRSVLVIATLGLALPAPAWCVVFGSPGAPTPAFSLRGSVGLGYSVRPLNGRNNSGDPLRDELKRFMVLGKLSILPLDWLEIGALIGGADAKRNLTDFQGSLGINGGGYLTFHPLLEDDFGINISLGGGMQASRNDGDVPDPAGAAGVRRSTTLKEKQYFAHITLSKTFKVWNFYGGATWNLSDVRHGLAATPTLGDVEGRSQFGMFVGVDYYVTPLIYFSLEGQNFHEDALFASIGMLLAPQKD
ncbi:MAG: hypothetical protein D6761_03015 [Candidatus Dadabacteria bacterium]|nr:MAG: hypothetical protein D6761_03015 [Candidatus Dadabacteria bacterium]